MLCYECSLKGNKRDAVGLCHFCSAALCPEHANVAPQVITRQLPLIRRVAMPRKARRLLCETCSAALAQLPEDVVIQHYESRSEERYELVVH